METQHDLLHFQEQGGTAAWGDILSISFLTNAPEGSLDRLESLGEGYSAEETLDPRFAVLLSQCLLSNHRSDLRQGLDIFEDFEDGTLCALCLRSERNSEALPVLPSSEECSMLSDNSRGKLPKPLQFVAPQRFVTSSLVQALSYIDNLLPGMELEIHTTTSVEACRGSCLEADDQECESVDSTIPGV